MNTCKKVESKDRVHAHQGLTPVLPYHQVEFVTLTSLFTQSPPSAFHVLFLHYSTHISMPGTSPQKLLPWCMPALQFYKSDPGRGAILILGPWMVQVPEVLETKHFDTLGEESANPIACSKKFQKS